MNRKDKLNSMALLVLAFVPYGARKFKPQPFFINGRFFKFFHFKSVDNSDESEKSRLIDKKFILVDLIFNIIII